MTKIDFTIPAELSIAFKRYRSDILEPRTNFIDSTVYCHLMLLSGNFYWYSSSIFNVFLKEESCTSYKVTGSKKKGFPVY